MPNCIRVIRKNSLNWGVFMHKLIIPASVEVFEDHEYSLDGSIKVLEFEEGSKLKSFGFNALKNLDRLKFNSENFITKENVVVMSLNPRGIVFVTKNLKKLKIDKKVEVVYSYAFSESNIEKIKLHKSLKRIQVGAFHSSKLKSVTFEKGTKLDLIDYDAFQGTKIKSIKIPQVRGKICPLVFAESLEIIQFH